MTNTPLHPETIAVVAGRPARGPGAPLNSPVVPASTYHHGGDPVYGRDGNPGWAAFEEALGALEHGSCVAFASGLAASSAILEELKPGVRVVAQHAPYFGVAEQLRERASRGQIALTTLPELTPAALAATVSGAALVWIESPTNPMLDVVDLHAVISIARTAGALSVVDNTFATPFGQTPLELGADAVLHSATKLIGGHSDLLLGAAVMRDAASAERLRARRATTGATPGALEAYLALRGLRTLPARLARAQSSARLLAGKLASHPSRRTCPLSRQWHDHFVRDRRLGRRCRGRLRGLPIDRSRHEPRWRRDDARTPRPLRVRTGGRHASDAHPAQRRTRASR